MIKRIQKSDIDSCTYLPLYISLKKYIGINVEGNKNSKICGIYYIYNKDNTLLYIGQSKNIASRITTHIRGKYRNSHKIKIEPILDEKNLNDIERFLIDMLKPIDNVMVGEKYDINDTSWEGRFTDTPANIIAHVDKFTAITIFPKIGVMHGCSLPADFLDTIKLVNSVHPKMIKEALAMEGIIDGKK